MTVALITNNTTLPKKNQKQTKNKPKNHPIQITSHTFCPFLFKWGFKVNMQNGYNLNNKALATKKSEVRWRVFTGRAKMKF